MRMVAALLGVGVGLGCGRIGFDEAALDGADAGPGLPSELGPAATACADSVPVGETRHVAIDGSDLTGDGSAGNPWRTVQFAYDQVAAGATVLVAPGTYAEVLTLTRTVQPSIVLRSAIPYRARLVGDNDTVRCEGCAGLTLEGFEVTQSQLSTLFSISIASGSRIVIRNNVVHDGGYALIWITSSDDVRIARNVLYDALLGGVRTMGSEGVVIEDNVVFNRYDDPPDIYFGPLVAISGIASRPPVVRRNILIDHEGGARGLVDVTDAGDVWVENNLILGNNGSPVLATVRASDTARLQLRHNTVGGDLAGDAFAATFVNQNTDAVVAGNMFVDPTGTMLALSAGTAERLVVNRNLYWNAGTSIPSGAADALSLAADPAAIVADPGLDPVAPTRVVWSAASASFADGSATICELFLALARRHGAIPPTSPAHGVAAPAHAPAHDLLGRPRPAPASLGCLEPSRP